MRAAYRLIYFSPLIRAVLIRLAVLSTVVFILWDALPARAQDVACGGGTASCSGPPPAQELVRPQVPAYAGTFFRMGVDVHAGIAGIGSDVSVPLRHRLDLRAGADFFSYSTVVASGGNAVNVAVRLRSARVGVDWYPTHHAFRISPLMVFADSNHLGTSVLLTPGETITLNNTTYNSDPSDPLHGSASIGLRRVSPGVSVGFGRLIPRRGHHFSFPTDLGFYYAGPPSYQVQFAGTACDPQVPGPAGCMAVQDDPSFQYNLNKFKAKYQTYVNYATFFPILSSGVAFAF